MKHIQYEEDTSNPKWQTEPTINLFFCDHNSVHCFGKFIVPNIKTLKINLHYCLDCNNYKANILQ